MFKLAVDLLWIRPEKVGGTESYTRNLLDSLLSLDDDFELYLLVSKDNYVTFEKYKEDPRYKVVICDVKSSNIKKRIIWENFNLSKTVKKLKLKTCFVPVYSKPLINNKGIKYIVTIHDMQHYHFPEYFSNIENLWMRLCWKSDAKRAFKIVAISEFVKEDILKRLGCPSKKISVIYNSILIDKKEVVDFSSLKSKYNIEANQYYFTVAQLRPHKNLDTIIRVFEEIKIKGIPLPTKWLISGVGGNAKNDLQLQIESKGLAGNIILTPFISNAERNTLYANCRAFLFPSIFEGFGMPPVEAMYMGVPVIATKRTCIPEVTLNQAYYVDNPFSTTAWISMMQNLKIEKKEINFNIYSKTNIAKKYYDLFSEVDNKSESSEV